MGRAIPLSPLILRLPAQPAPQIPLDQLLDGRYYVSEGSQIRVTLLGLAYAISETPRECREPASKTNGPQLDSPPHNGPSGGFLPRNAATNGRSCNATWLLQPLARIVSGCGQAVSHRLSPTARPRMSSPERAAHSLYNPMHRRADRAESFRLYRLC